MTLREQTCQVHSLLHTGTAHLLREPLLIEVVASVTTTQQKEVTRSYHSFARGLSHAHVHSLSAACDHSNRELGIPSRLAHAAESHASILIVDRSKVLEKNGTAGVSLQLRRQTVSFRILRHVHAIHQRLDALSTDVLCHVVGCIVGRAVDLDDVPINLTLHPQGSHFEVLDLPDPPAHGHAKGTDESVKHWIFEGFLRSRNETDS